MPELSIPESIEQAEYLKGETSKKIDFEMYFELVRENDDIHEAMFEAMSGKMLLKDQIKYYTPMISFCVEN